MGGGPVPPTQPLSTGGFGASKGITAEQQMSAPSWQESLRGTQSKDLRGSLWSLLLLPTLEQAPQDLNFLEGEQG